MLEVSPEAQIQVFTEAQVRVTHLLT